MIVSYFPIRLKGNSKCISGNSFSPLGAQKKEFSDALQTSLTGVRLCLRGRLLRLEENQNYYYTKNGFDYGHSATKKKVYCKEKI